MPNLLAEIGSQVAFVNTYHLVTHPGPEIIEKAGGIHAYSKLPIPLMSDSGGFQVFSLAQNKRKATVRGEEEALVEKITEDGVTFRSAFDGSLLSFTPETSIVFQKQIGADLIMAFDECTSADIPHKKTKESMERTHRWLLRCINKFRASDKQYLYGIIQGGVFEDLRKESAEFVTKQDVDGIAIGSIANSGEGKTQMQSQVDWVTEYLPNDKPVHLLGIGYAEDIANFVRNGIDTFDCVEPTRVARMGYLYQIQDKKPIVGWKEIDINKGIFKNNLEKVDEQCSCNVCENFTKSYLHHLFKQKELLGYTLATYHNLSIMERFMASIRKAISDDIL
jgi:queuine tRNA-ribosyltransferase